MIGPTKIRLGMLAALAVALSAGAAPAFARPPEQVAREQKMAAASGQQFSGGSVPLRVMLVISDTVRAYHVTMFLSRMEFGARLAKEAEKVFNGTFAATQVVSMVPAEPHALDNFDLVISIESPEARHQSALFSWTESLSAVFVARRPNGEEIYRGQLSDSEKGSGNSASTQDQLGEAVTRKFIQELILNPRVRSLLAPAPPPEVKVARDDSAALASAGLDVPPPPPWGAQEAASAQKPPRPQPDGRP
ncbi:MAG TPA: hypothetical protein VL099_13450 [Candidatus Binatia bacterium]|nr:hypothetical protein [Candidatus Binatia bacterium]